MESHVASTVSLEILDSKYKDAIDQLFAWVVMPNHVHLLLRPRKELMSVLQRRGRFWLEESFDHWVRNDLEFGRTGKVVLRWAAHES